ncbi:MAG: class I SAM-dependent methyltransferase [Lachnospiraceae bacterium]|nr:class I SAM-dependent methyltransferase [Lachnospiraceae bacterium]
MKLDQEKVKSFYNSVSNVWGNHDPWHDYSQKVITTYIEYKDIFRNSIVLNAGSAGNSYGIKCRLMYHVDIADEKIKNIDNAVIASIEKMPFDDLFFDNIICVGSVLNYCDALTAISELSRVLKPSGNLILEYESSWGFEYLHKDCYKKDACIITTEYIESSHNQWLYSPKYIINILKTYNFNIVEKYPFHISDGLFSRFLDDQSAINLVQIDKLLCKLPFFSKHGNNIIMHCQKNLL